jgi:pilus assembly protein CpaE
MLPEELEPDLLQNVLINSPSGVAVLAAPRAVSDGELVKPEHVKIVIEMLRDRYSYVVLDMPHDFRETSLAGLDLADGIVTVLAPELASVRAMAGTLEVFDSLGYAREKVTMVLNWVFERRGLARKDIENVLRQSVQMVLPFAPETFVSAINLGAPPVIAAPMSPIGALFEDFAYSLSRVEDQKKKPANPSESWKRVQERLLPKR